MAYLSQVKSNGNIYVYLTVYDPTHKERNTKRERHIYRFGRLEKAIEKMNIWMLIPSMFPEELKNLGFDTKALKEWISFIQEKNENIPKKFYPQNKLFDRIEKKDYSLQ